MKIAMITEGTYPFHPGGVSTWCDQIIRGLAEHSFSLHPVGANGTERMIYQLPENVLSINPIPLWSLDRPQRVSQGSLLAAERYIDDFVETLLGRDEEQDNEAVVFALHQLFLLGQGGVLSASLRSSRTIDGVLERYQTSPAGRIPSGVQDRSATVEDVATFLDLLEHWLRPLSSHPIEADVCHPVANGLATLVAMTSKWAYGTPFVLTEHGVYLRECFLANRPGSMSHVVRALVLRFFKLLVQAGYESADLIAPCCVYNQLWEEEGGAAPEKIRVVHNGIKTHPLAPILPEPAVPTLVYVGRIDPLKDIETLLRGFAIVHGERPDVLLRIYGDATAGKEAYAEDCVELQRELGLEESVTFEGHISPPTAAYEGGHVVLQTSISEGLPYTILEAMETGRPMIATDVGGVNEAVGDTGVLIPPRNPEDLAAACLLLLGDDELRLSLGRAGRERVLAMFTVERMLDDYRRVYDIVRMPAVELEAEISELHPSYPLIIDSEETIVENEGAIIESVGA